MWATRFLAVVVVGAAAAFYWAQRFSGELAGGTPLMHVGIPYGFTLEEMPDVEGKAFVVTGANSGLGLSTSKILAAHGARVLMACRSKDKCDAAIEEIRKSTDKGELVVPAPLDLSSLKACRAFAKAVRQDPAVASGKLASLVFNAGYMPNSFSMTEEGLETSFVANHLGHFLLFKDLEDLVVKAKATVVAVTSSVHFTALPTPEGVPMSKDQVNDKASFDSLTHYGMAKLANVLFARELDARYYSKGVVATAAHPGGVQTNFLDSIFQNGKELDSFANFAFKILHAVQGYMFWTSDEAALTLVGAAVRPTGHGEYTIPIHRTLTPSSQALNADVAKQFWDLSEKLCAEVLEG